MDKLLTETTGDSMASALCPGADSVHVQKIPIGPGTEDGEQKAGLAGVYGISCVTFYQYLKRKS